MKEEYSGHGKSQYLSIGTKIVTCFKHTSVAFEISFF